MLENQELKCLININKLHVCGLAQNDVANCNNNEFVISV